MTTLVMVQTEDDVILGWDSQITTANQYDMMTTPKYFVNGGLIFGVSGSLRALDLVETTDFSGSFEVGKERHFLIQEVVPKLRDMLEDDPSFLSEDGSMQGFGVHVVINGQAFDFDNRFSPSQNGAGIYTVGSGCDYARGVLFYLKQQYAQQAQPREGLDESSVFDALETAAAIDPYTGGTLNVVKASDYLKENA